MPSTSWSDMTQSPIVIPSDALSEAFTGLVHPVLDRIIASIYDVRTVDVLRDAFSPNSSPANYA